MKVNIGPYKNWYGPYQIASIIFFWVPKYPDEKIEERWDVKAKDKLGPFLADKTPLANICEWIHSKRKRKVNVKIDDYDIWSLDSTLSLIILPALIEFSKDKHGFGWIDSEDVPALYHPNMWPTHKDGVWDEGAPYRWEWVIREMIWTFEALVREDEEFHPDNERLREKRIANGLRLFGKYYRGLWT